MKFPETLWAIFNNKKAFNLLIKEGLTKVNG